MDCYITIGLAFRYHLLLLVRARELSVRTAALPVMDSGRPRGLDQRWSEYTQPCSSHSTKV